MFKKYCSIENHYWTKDIDKWITRFPELLTCKYIIQEKIHGSNISFIFQPNKPMLTASRNQLAPNHYGCDKIIKNDIDLKNILSEFQKISDETILTLHLFGEIFGKGIQKGIYYGDEKYIRFFDICLDIDYCSQDSFDCNMYCNFNNLFEKFKVPILGYTNSLQEALDFDVNIDSKITDRKDNQIEGIVIKPYNKVYNDSLGRIFYLKKVSEKFKEKASRKERKVKVDKIIPQEVIDLHNKYLEFVTENRFDHIESHEGKIESNKLIGKYLGLFLKDAWKDFYKEYGVEYEKIMETYVGMRKYITNASSEAKVIIFNKLKGN